MALNTEQITAENVLGTDSTHTLFNISLPRSIASIAQHVRDLWNRTNLDSIYPVGSIYLSATPTMRNPAHILGGGQWELIPNKFLIGAGGQYDAGDTGGDTTIGFNFTSLSHLHGASYYVVGDGAPTTANLQTDSGLSGYYGAVTSYYQQDFIPPYFAVYIWLRVA